MLMTESNRFAARQHWIVFEKIFDQFTEEAGLPINIFPQEKRREQVASQEYAYEKHEQISLLLQIKLMSEEKSPHV